MTKQKKIKIGEKKYVQDGNQFIEEGKLKAHNERMKTYFKLGGKLCNAKMPKSKKAIEEQKD